MTFSFHTDAESQLFCERIVEAMELLYDIESVKGCELLNDMWRAFDWRKNSKTANHIGVLYHETERDWAERIGNPRPYDEQKAELKLWKNRTDEAERRIARFREVGIHKWLCPA